MAFVQGMIIKMVFAFNLNFIEFNAWLLIFLFFFSIVIRYQCYPPRIALANSG